MDKTQGKVSIVIPCYNKEDYIGAMLDSIISQKWDNIELILVNDGSSDGTLDIMKSYLPKLENRGFTVNLICQENSGCCNAVHTGLSKVTGDYLAVVDADDALYPEYVSTMAGFLEVNREYDFCTCDYIYATKNHLGEIVENYQRFRWPKNYTVEFFLCNDPNKAVWAFITRMDYIRKSRLIETFYTDTRGSYEASFFIPFCAYKGRMKHFAIPLYRYNINDAGLSNSETMGGAIKYWKEYHRCVLAMLDRLEFDVINKYERRYFESLSYFYVLKRLLALSEFVEGGKPRQEELRQTFLRFVNGWLNPEPVITYDAICEDTVNILKAFELALNGLWLVPKRRIIGYGVLGKEAGLKLPLLKGTRFEPTELWDANGDGIDALKPLSDLSTLTEKDIVIVFPRKRETVNKIFEGFENCKAQVIHAGVISDILAQEKYPQLERLV